MAGHASLESALPDLWRLAVYLRCDPSGCDARFVRDHFACRAVALGKEMKWQNQVRHLVSLQNEQNTATRQSREKAWQQVPDEQHAQHGQQLPKSISVQSCDCLLALLADRWVPVLTLTCYSTGLSKWGHI